MKVGEFALDAWLMLGWLLHLGWGRLNPKSFQECSSTQRGLGSIVWSSAWSWHAKGAVRLSSSTIVHKRKLILEWMQHSRTTCQEVCSNNDAGTVNRADCGTILHKRKLVLELTQRGFPTNHPSRWLALYGYLQFLFRRIFQKGRVNSLNLSI
jgi:hypothetical protein